MKKAVATLCVAVSLVGCGGGGGGGGDGGSAAGTGGSGSNPPPSGGGTPPASVTITVNSPPANVQVPYGIPYSTEVAGNWSGTNLGSATVYLQVVDSNNTFAVPAVAAASGNTFRYTLGPGVGTLAGDRTGTLTVNACKDPACAQRFDGPSGSVSYRVQITPLGEWETVQRDASHTGYVPIIVDPTRLTKAWEWTFPQDPTAASSYVLRPATGGGMMYAVGINRTSAQASFNQMFSSVDEATGTLRWSQQIAGNVHVLGPAAYGGLAYVPTIGADRLLTAYDGTTGSMKFRYGQTTDPLASTLAPTFHQTTAYFFGGHLGEELHAVDAATGTLLWAKARRDYQNTTPAVDDSYIYYPSNRALEILDRRTGNTVASITNPVSDSQHASAIVPMLGSRGNVIVNSYSATNRTAKLSSFDIAGLRWEWATQYSYNPLPALANGVIYATRSDGAPTLDAIDEVTGNVLWSWNPPASDNQSRVVENIAATKNLVFVSTTGNIVGSGYVWAIDVNTRQAVWRYPANGYSVISGRGTLYILNGSPSLPARKVIAIRLR
ncbi:hypothetical protein GCM10025759_29320 [Lysobacter panacisoli]|uniref:Pyrrolo-quinoline quinone repeat domain-containing protein n=1 Tax=Lysobacter panacisoli TaxID=1255263 RepID=A0ABP9LNT6_9GAMM